MSMSRQLRRAAERRERKLERKAARVAEITPDNSTNAEPAESPESEDLPIDDAFFQLVEEIQSKRTPELERTGPTGPRTQAGKAISSLNNLKHGLAGAFRVLESESQSDFDTAHHALIAEHSPATPTESELIRRMAEHAWLSRRAQLLQEASLVNGDDKRFYLYSRYPTY